MSEDLNSSLVVTLGNKPQRLCHHERNEAVPFRYSGFAA